MSVFIASPGDVASAREATRHAIDRVNRLVARPNGILFESIGWEDVPAGRGRRAQEVLNPFVDAADIFIGLLGRRFGSPTGIAESGTYEEYQRATDRWNTASPKPDVKVYFRKLKASELRDPGEQLQRVLQFKQAIAPTDLYHEFADDDDLEQRIENDLAAWVYDRLERGTLPAQSQVHGLGESDVKLLTTLLTGSATTVTNDSIHKLVQTGFITVSGQGHALANSTEGFVAIAKHLNVEPHRREFLQSAYFSDMMQAHLTTVIQARYHLALAEDHVDILRQLAIMSTSVTSCLLSGDTSLYDNLFEHAMKIGKHEYATNMLHQNLIQQASIAYASDAVNGMLLDTVDGKQLVGQAVTVDIRGVFEDGRLIRLTSVVPIMRAKFAGPGVIEKGQMVSAASPEFFIHDGTILLQLGLFEQAATAFRTALKHDLTSEARAAAINNLGLTFLNTGERSEALRCFVDAATLNPQSVEIKNNIALLRSDASGS